MSRTTLSRPVQRAVADGVLTSNRSFFDYGCGRGGDVNRLVEDGFRASGWDPLHRPNASKEDADVVNLGYVVNVIEDPTERTLALKTAWELANAVLVIAARPDWEAPQVRGMQRGDGIITSTGTFQKFFEQEELKVWIQGCLGVEPIAAAPGIFYVFRNQSEAAGIRARRFRNRVPGEPRARKADLVWDSHREMLEPLAAFWDERGRIPDRSELDEVAKIESTIGSLKTAVRFLRKVLGESRFEESRKRAAVNLQVFLALESFRGRPRLSELPSDVILDVRAHFGSYKNACEIADGLLFALADNDRLSAALLKTQFGKILPDAIYVHVDYVYRLDALLRVYEGAGRALIGDPGDVTLVKMSRVKHRVSYLWYPCFESHGHPVLATSLRADLRTCHIKWTDFRGRLNVPVLHRKELFVPNDHPSRVKFANLTRKEETAGLFKDTSAIGTVDGWMSALSSAGLRVAGHQLKRNAQGDPQ